MPLYFFNVRDGRDLPDETGTVCKDPAAARVEAVGAAGALLRDLGACFWQDADWQMHVTDEQGGTVCDLRITGTIGAPSERAAA